MAEIKVINLAGKELSPMNISDTIFAVEINKHLIHEVVINQLANRRVGTSSTKSRGEVTGSTKKPFRQKGTGRARQGTVKSPLMPGGGIAFGPKPRDYSYRLNRKSKKIAMKSALTAKLQDEKAWVIEDVSVKNIKTKVFADFFKTIEKNDKYNLIIISNGDEKENIIKSARNIAKTKVINVNSINVYDLVRYENVFFSKNAVSTLEEVYNAN
ncbi:MAG: 50S ribosomal protein L4 [Candidatus Muiribacterium halophilum]|uniref:Large ribosomal subunit protein uL4 n=1 Tax=Muiribacterium halophilum TaxID=2053465 RepID=A0A2N5ZJK0_MUIH1|nr:MAG: 50S ribosomal protein L4 [Candidatus Muirbacterium halophilum]